MDEVIDRLLDSIKSVRELNISDDEKLEHIKGICRYAQILLEDK